MPKRSSPEGLLTKDPEKSFRISERGCRGIFCVLRRISVHSRVLNPSNLRFCHSSNHPSLKPHFFFFFPNFHPSKNQPFVHIPSNQTPSFSSGSVTKASMATSSPSTEARDQSPSLFYVCAWSNICRKPSC
ncbi:hypothetical protein GBA52_027203 [Prunus armeniaca]|nr:hypothetical protein GBA52_027203 [Prunus armeniaca]